MLYTEETCESTTNLQVPTMSPPPVLISMSRGGYRNDGFTMPVQEGVNTQQWLKALMKNDASKVEIILTEILLPKVKNHVLNDPLWSSHNDEFAMVNSDYMQWYQNCFKLSPFAIASVSGSHDVMRVLLRHGADVTGVDHHKNNVLHTLVYAAKFDKTLKPTLLKTYEFIKTLLDTESLKTMLLAENMEGCRPLELAAFLGAFPLCTAFLETKGVYLTREEQYGVCQVRWYDITEYEMPSLHDRISKSPLTIFLSLDESHIGEEDTTEMFSHGIIQAWTKAKMNSYLLLMVLWFLCRCSFICAFLFHDVTEPWTRLLHGQVLLNGTWVFADRLDCPVHEYFVPDYVRQALSCFILVYACITIIIYVPFLVNQIVRHCRKRKAISKHWLDKRRRAVRETSYICGLLVLCFGVLVGSFIEIQSRIYQDYKVSAGIITCVYLVTYMGMNQAFLFFMQVLPWIGHFVIVIQRMVQELLKFLFVFIIFILSFASLFERILYPGIGEECGPKLFSTFPYAMYGTMLAATHGLDFSWFKVSDPVGIFVAHTCFIFVGAILLVNFLIALFANSMAKVYDNKLVVQTLQRLSVVLLLERFLLATCPKLKVATMHRHFTIKEGRVYICRIGIGVDTSS